MASPVGEWKRRKEVFDICAQRRLTNPDDPKILSLKDKLKTDPSLAQARSTELHPVSDVCRGGQGQAWLDLLTPCLLSVYNHHSWPRMALPPFMWPPP